MHSMVQAANCFLTLSQTLFHQCKMGSGHVRLSLQVGSLFTTLQYCIRLVDHNRLNYVHFSHGLALLIPRSILPPCHHYSTLTPSPVPPVTTHPSLQLPFLPSQLLPHSSSPPSITHPHELPVHTPFFFPQKKVSCNAGTQ